MSKEVERVEAKTIRLPRIGLDVGTYHICSARTKNEEIEVKKEINAFYTLELENKFMLNMMKQSGAPVIEIGNNAYVLGESAKSLALSMGKEFQRPMKNGILSVNEKEAFNILAVIIRSMVGDISEDGAILHYSVPANAINTATNADYHTKIVQSILDSYEINGKKVKAFPINEALAIIFAELGKDQNTGISLSFGAGMVNCCYAMFAAPMVEFSITNSGDWIDEQAAKSCGENISYVNEVKKSVDLSAEPENMIHRAVVYHYQLMIENSLKGIADGIRKAGSKANPGNPVKIVIAGGTASPKGFLELFKKTFNEKIDFPIEVSEIYLAKDHLYTVAKGCLIASENYSE